MEGKKSFLMYILVLIFIVVIVVFYVLPNDGEKILECSLSSNSQGITTVSSFKSRYVNGKFEETDNEFLIDLSKNWIQKNEYKYSLEQDSKIYTDAGFTYVVEFDNDKKYVVAKMHGDKESLNDDIVYHGKIKNVREHFEKEGYICKEETIK